MADIFQYYEPEFEELITSIITQNTIKFKVTKARIHLLETGKGGINPKMSNAEKIAQLKQDIDRITDRLDILNLYSMNLTVIG